MYREAENDILYTITPGDSRLLATAQKESGAWLNALATDFIARDTTGL